MLKNHCKSVDVCLKLEMELGTGDDTRLLSIETLHVRILVSTALLRIPIAAFISNNVA